LGKGPDIAIQGIINATGPFSDALLKMDATTGVLSEEGTSISTPILASSYKPVVAPSSGVHVILPNYYSPRTMGLLDPATSDGRVIFFLPWQGNTIAGTTDVPVDVTDTPLPREEEVQWVLEEIKRSI
jgi:glycerol-3-phosphate dehydrogenase